MNSIKQGRFMIAIIFTIVANNALSADNFPVHSWWIQCNGNSANSTCLTDQELSKFKTICSAKRLKEECRMVVDFVVAKTRLAEEKITLAKILRNENSLNDDVSSKITSSFAVGEWPSCNPASKKKLFFGKNPREKEELLKIYESLANMPCPAANNSNSVWVAIGKVHDSKDEFEVFTIEGNKNFKTIRTAIGAGPFEQMAKNFVFQPESN